MIEVIGKEDLPGFQLTARLTAMERDSLQSRKVIHTTSRNASSDASPRRHLQVVPLGGETLVR